jgi:hypothetical protein
MSRIQYNPNTIIPSSPEGLVKYLQEELDKISFTFANLETTTDSGDDEDGDGGSTTPTSHNTLTGRTEFDSHPQSAITDLVADQQAQDVLIDRNTKVFFGADEPPADEASEGDIWFVEGFE